jgi:hypothetical protein
VVFFENSRASVLSSFNFNLFEVIQDLTSPIQDSSEWIEAETFCGVVESYNCVSSANA